MTRTAKQALSGLRVAVVALLGPLYACGGTRGAIADAIDAELAKEQVCYAHGEMGGKPAWPILVGRPFMDMLGNGEMDPVLAAMQSAGYVTVKTSERGFEGRADQITPNDDARKWWNDSTGWCVGRKAIVAVKEWAPPEGELLQVSYTWKLVDVPRWARHDSFKGIEGMSAPADDETIVRKTSNGWRVGL